LIIILLFVSLLATVGVLSWWLELVGVISSYIIIGIIAWIIGLVIYNLSRRKYINKLDKIISIIILPSLFIICASIIIWAATVYMTLYWM
jgi:hypothetical protein